MDPKEYLSGAMSNFIAYLREHSRERRPVHPTLIQGFDLLVAHMNQHLPKKQVRNTRPSTRPPIPRPPRKAAQLYTRAPTNAEKKELIRQYETLSAVDVSRVKSRLEELNVLTHGNSEIDLSKPHAYWIFKQVIEQIGRNVNSLDGNDDRGSDSDSDSSSSRSSSSSKN